MQTNIPEHYKNKLLLYEISKLEQFLNVDTHFIFNFQINKTIQIC